MREHLLVLRNYDLRGRAAARPVDQHMLLALAAPRPLYVASATLDPGPIPAASFSAVYAAPAYRLFGLEAWRDRAAAARHPIAAASATTCARGRMTSPPTIGNSSSTSSTGRSPRSDSAPVPLARCRRAGRRKHPRQAPGAFGQAIFVAGVGDSDRPQRGRLQPSQSKLQGIGPTANENQRSEKPS